MNNSSIHAEPFADNTRQSLSLTTNNNASIPLQKKARKNKIKSKKKKQKKNPNDKCVLQIQRSPFETKFNTIATPTEKKVLASLMLSTHSSKIDYDKSHSSNSDCTKIDQLTNEVSDDNISLEESYSYADIKPQKSPSNIDNKLQKGYSNVVEKQRDDAELLYNDNLGMHQMKLLLDELKGELKGEFNKRFDQLDTQIKNVEQRIENVNEKVNKKIDKLSQKIDNIYETNAIQVILNRLRADHNLDVPYMPTNRIFSENYSTYTKSLFNRFQNYAKQHYQHLWTKIHKDISISTQPEQMEFDILGFSFEHSSKERTLIGSPNLQPVLAPSSYSYLKPFRANTVIIAEVTTSFLTFHNDHLLLCEKKGRSSQTNTERKNSSFKLFQKLLQLERGLAFILLYYNIQLEHVLVVLFGRFNYSKNHRSPDYIYRMLFESSFSKNIPLLHKLYLRDRDEQNKQLYFIC
ncbi:unnamed protein product [Rotaria sordida]|uniref:Uncharacterized protein n=1 Tax=Rotaria sordida TaxID=392033 RepID=A0A814RAN3_9BILA|nr:unnamed protein product [Rotaria sordida]